MKFSEFVKICHEKEVFKKLSLYVVFSWVLIQVISVIWEPMGLSNNAMTYSLILLLVGFPTYIFYVWRTHLKNVHPAARSRSVSPDKEKKTRLPFNFQTYYFISLGMISFIVGSLVVFVYFNKFSEDVFKEEIELQDTIAVLKFGNKTGVKDFDLIGDMASDWIIHGISQYQIAKVITPETFEEYSKIYKASMLPAEQHQSLQEYFNPKRIITGNYFLKRDQLIFQGSVIDGKTNTLLFSFESVECNSNNPLDCIELLKQKILGFLVTEKNQELNLQETPPKYEAYSTLLKAKENRSNHQLYLGLLNESIAIDSTYFEPHYLVVDYYYNRQNFAKADSLLKIIKPRFSNSFRQKNILNFLEALLSGNNKMAYRYQQKEYNYAPFDLDKNMSSMVIALEFVNLPDEVEAIYSEINSDNLIIENCSYCEFRNYAQAMAYLELGEYTKVVTLLEEIVEYSDRLILKKALISAHIKLENYELINEVISQYESKMDPEDWLDLKLYIGMMLLIEKKDNLAKAYFEKIISIASSEKNGFVLAMAYYFNEDYVNAVTHFEKIVSLFPDNIEYAAMLAISYEKNGEKLKAQEALVALENLRQEFQFGALDYAFGQYYAAINDEENLRKYLLKSVAAGNKYTNFTYQNDPLFKEVKSENYFKEIMTYWH